MAAAGRGEYVGHYKQLATNILARHPAGKRAIIRPSNEFNGTWFSHSAPAKCDPADWKKAWVQFVTAFKGVPGGSVFEFEWCFNIGENEPELCWPGAEHVDFIGID
ncbi:glycosyl hydrolase, partial [Staphylococcus aureus]